MHLKRIAAIAAAAIAIATASPALAASEWPYDPGDFVEISMISVDDGHDLDYAKFLAGQWKDSQEFAKSKGWISSYEILYNFNKRAGEPDIYLLTTFPNLPDKAESLKRDEAYLAHMKTTDNKLEQESGARASYRHQIGSMLLRKMDGNR